jgi:hypothetical protein
MDGSESISPTTSANFRAIALQGTTLSCNINLLLQSLFYSFVASVKVIGPSVLEGKLALERGDVSGYAAALDWLDKGSPDIWTEPRRDNVRVVRVEERDGEGLEVSGRGSGEVDQAAVGEIQGARRGRVVDGLFAGELVERLQSERRA